MVHFIDLTFQNGKKMKAKKIFCVIAYDISDDKCRNRVIKVLEKYGMRVNYSVFECMFTHAQFRKIQEQTAILINSKEDSIIYYPICVDCFSKIVYQPCRHIASKLIVIR